jgi:transposase
VKIHLTEEDRNQLNKMVKKGTSKAREIARAKVLLYSDVGKAPTYVSEALELTKRTIQNIKERYLEGGIPKAIMDAPRPGQPTKFDGKQRAKITALACTEAPEGYAKWSLSLLADKAVEIGIVDEISRAHEARILKKTK